MRCSTKTKPRNDYDELVVLGRHCSDREQRAEAAERDLTKLKLLAYLSEPHRRGDGRRGDRRGELRHFRPRASSCRPKGWSASKPSATTTTASTAPRTPGRPSRRQQLPARRLLRVAVARVDLERREMDFRVVERKKGRQAKAARSTKRHEGARRREEEARKNARTGQADVEKTRR